MSETRPGSSKVVAGSGVPRVFISSTSEDLKSYRGKAQEAANAAGVLPVMMEYFTATGARPPLEECLARVVQCDVLVVMVAHRYGWRPQVSGKSITWLECEEAAGRGMEVLAFLVDEKAEWPASLKDSHRLVAAAERGTATTELLGEVTQDIADLRMFKQWLDGRGVRAIFSSPEELQRKVESALRDWRQRQPGLAGVNQPAAPDGDPAVYLEQLREQCSWIDIRGLQVGSGKAHRFPIEELYIPLTMAGGSAERGGVLLEGALRHPRLVVVGDPGSGKTTFVRRLALAKVNEFATAADTPFPILIRINELLEHIRRHSRGSKLPADSPRWLAEFLAFRSEELNQGLSVDFFRERIEKQHSVLLLDGLDEAPSAGEREAAVRLLEAATRAYRECRFVVTTRPLSYTGRGVLAGFETARIEPLEEQAIGSFLEKWCWALFPESGAAAKRHLGELREALRSVPEIRRMARNPVMLTALAVVHWNERRLPEQRADLYESILNWLARSREMRPERASADRCLRLLEQLALAMQTHRQGRQVQVEKGWAAEALAPRFEGATEAERREAALRFVEEEEVDSGIVVSRGAAVRFWHLTFQEYLAARAVGGLVEADQQELLLAGDGIYRAEWREMVLLLGGVLCGRQGPGKVDGLVAAVLDRLGKNARLAAQAKCAGLVGCMVNDLRPLGYQPADSRYRGLMDAVLGVFDREKAKGVEFAVRLEAAEALGQAGDPRIGRRESWVRIEGGTFRMGEKAGKKVTVATFEIGRYPVTVMEYRQFVEDGGYQEERWWHAGGFGSQKEPDDWEDQNEHPNRPVTSVSWYEAAAYAAWAGARLPREAEWEFAARGVEGREYPWGKETPDATRANYGEDGPGYPTPVGFYPAGATSPEGIRDMAGNVWEWVTDWSDENRTLRVLRGGSFRYSGRGLRAAYRVNDVPEYRDGNFGFRCVRESEIP